MRLSLAATSPLSPWVNAALAGDPTVSSLELREARDRAAKGPHYWAWWGWEPWEHNRRTGGITAAVDGSSHWLHRAGILDAQDDAVGELLGGPAASRAGLTQVP